jgi:hypothetical protein
MNSLKMRQLIDDQLAGINYKSIEKQQQMSVHIQPTDDDNEFLVNGKTVRRDMDGIWKETAELTPTELRYFAEYMNLINYQELGGITATYTI